MKKIWELIPTGMANVCSGHPLVFNERQGNPHTTGLVQKKLSNEDTHLDKRQKRKIKKIIPRTIHSHNEGTYQITNKQLTPI